MSKNKQKSRKEAKAKSHVKTTTSFWQNKDLLYPLLAILAITAIVYLPSLGNDFVNWDDDVNVLENTNLNGFTFENIVRIFHPEHGRVIGNYNPLTIFTFAIEKAFFGLNPTVFHFNNLLLHLLCVFFVYRITLQMGLSKWGAGLAALLFGIHPMRVESVAWITERKDVLFGVFYLAAIFNYIKYLTQKQQKYMVYTLLLFVLSLFSKIQAVSLPLSLIAIDYWFNRPVNIKMVLDKWLFFALSLAFGLLGVLFLGEDGSLEDITNYTFFERLLVGAYSYCVYLIKFLFPYEMVTLYPYPKEITGSFYVAPLGVLVAIGAFVFAWIKNYRAAVFGIAFFTFNIMFLLQILAAGQGFQADRFTYIAYFGLFFLLAYGMDYLLKNKPQSKSFILGGAAVYLLLFAYLSVQQIKTWENGATLWSHVIKYYPNTNTAYANLGHFYRDKSNLAEAIKYYSIAIERKPSDGKTYNSRGKLYLDNGKLKEALVDFSKAAQLNPEIAEIHINQGAAYGASGDYQSSLASLNKGLEIDPKHKNGYLNRSIVHLYFKDDAAALKDYDSYLELDPFYANIWYERGATLNRMGRVQEALTSLNKAIQFDGTKKPFYEERSRINQRLGNAAAAKADKDRANSF